MTVTIKDVAREAGVATSTVSRTLKDSPLISENTKVKVRQAMQKLGYTPNFAAQDTTDGYAADDAGNHARNQQAFNFMTVFRTRAVVHRQCRTRQAAEERRHFAL